VVTGWLVLNRRKFLAIEQSSTKGALREKDLIFFFCGAEPVVRDQMGGCPKGTPYYNFCILEK
jgi:hypothetical protein